MSVIIKDMKMPEKCTACGYFYYEPLLGIQRCKLTNLFIEGYSGDFPKSCPLVELPEHHGRLKDYLESKCSAIAFQVGDIIHLKGSNTYGLVTYIDTELNQYCILMDSGKTLQDYCDFDIVEKTWESTDRKLYIDNVLQSIMPMGLRKE